jgi:hypothetical protein
MTGVGYPRQEFAALMPGPTETSLRDHPGVVKKIRKVF